jgi:hypothetical protein
MDVTPTWLGVVTHLHVAPRAFLPMRGMDAIDWSKAAASSATAT